MSRPEGARGLNARGREALRFIDRADEAWNGGETWDEPNHPGPGRIQHIHWRTANALTRRGLITATNVGYDDDDGRQYPVNRLELTDAGRAALTGEIRG